MSCLITSGYSLGCKTMSGIEKVFIGEWNDSSTAFTLGTDNKVTAFTGVTVSFYGFSQPVETASFTAPGEISSENNSYSFSSTLMITLSGMDAALINKIRTLAIGVWRVIVKDKNGKYFIMGINSPVQVSAVESGLGKASTDLHGAVLTFSVKDTFPIYEIDSAVAQSLIV